ncbi:MAG: LamG domain-containing protein [Nevskiaceae bacterium]|nr:MAG: LamG domain-containing protein [Nevskiaceae bacterium]TBR73715.1 MAG: LamG domain-containing protein [Nevskiaceae bacterium]
MTKLSGYADPLSVTAGQAVDFMISAEASEHAEVRLVRLLHGDENPQGPGFVEEEVDASLPASIAVRRQYAQLGSHARVRDKNGVLAGLRRGTLYAFISASRPGGTEQAIAGRWSEPEKRGYLLLLGADGCLQFRAGDGERSESVALTRRLAANCWYLVAAAWDIAAGKATLTQIGVVDAWNSRIGPVVPYEYDDHATAALGLQAIAPASTLFLIAGAGDHDPGRGDFVSRIFNGKIDRPAVHRDVLDRDALVAISRGGFPPRDGILAYWDTSRGYSADGIGDVMEDIGPLHLHADGVNRPIRAMTGWNWRGKDDCFRLDPSQYGGVAFHDDALIDSGWESSLRFAVPAGLKSGVYALRVRAGSEEDHIPFFVRAAKPKAPIAVLMPTFTYLAYANEHLGFDAPIAQAICANTPVVSRADLDWKAHDEFGLSTYDVHSDGAGVCYSSWRRPILNLRPRYRMPSTAVPWGLPADLSLIWWLEHAGYDYEILTDHDLDREGVSALKPYRAVVNCTHPEYYSERMLDATEQYIAEGGRVMYLGGNGYYWVTAVRPDEPWCIEVRKLDVGSRAWQACPGEYYLATTGEKSGLWRSRGRAPQKVVGVGFTTEGFDECRPFERLPDSRDERVAWIFNSIGKDELIGNFGLALGGASGLETDRYDLALGTPPHTLLLAASFHHSDNYPLVSEDIGYAFPGRGGTQDPWVRGDMTFFTAPNGGAVFAAGSIAWSQALPCNGGDNNVARVTGNVLDAFCGMAAFPGCV